MRIIFPKQAAPAIIISTKSISPDVAGLEGLMPEVGQITPFSTLPTGAKAMKSTFAVTLCVLLLLFSACSQKVNDPADVQAIKNNLDAYAKAVNAGDVDGIVATMTDKAIYALTNSPVIVGKEAARSLFQTFFSLSRSELSLPVEDVRVIGGLAVARGTWTEKITPKAQGVAPISDSGSWIATFVRQSDGSWKWNWCVPNSNQPLPGSTANGAEEKALIQIEQDWAKAMGKPDIAAVESFLAKEWTYNTDGQIMTRSQSLAELKSGVFKVESLELKDISPHVFGDVAVVTMTAAMKGKYKGTDISGPARSTDFFVKHDGRWQAVSTQNVTVK
jgi:ketosteroid isomerase-like protein